MIIQALAESKDNHYYWQARTSEQGQAMTKMLIKLSANSTLVY